MKKKFLALMLVTSMLLSSTSVTAREIAPTVGSGTTKVTNEQETPPTVKKTPIVPSTTEALKEETTEKPVDIPTPNTTSPTTETKTEAKSVPSTDVTEKVDENVKEAELKSVEETEKMTKELLIKTDKESEIPKDGKILSSYEDTYLVSFPNTDIAKEVYEDKNTDASLNIPFGIATGTDKASTVVEPDVLNNLEETLKADDTKGFKITDEDYSIAVIDTGMPKTEKNVEFASMLDDKGYDDHGHGTMILESIRKQNADAKILSIKALNKNGYGDAATIYAAIKYAIERNVDIINLSISGFATEGNKIIEDIIKEAISSGIIVVGAAGNDNLPASAFIPGGIDEAVIVGACNEKNKRKTFSNYGITVDYYANAGSTSEAAAIVTGTLSANNGDVKKLDEIFFKTPDLSIFEEDLKEYREPDDEESETIGYEDCSNDGEDISDKNNDPITDEEYLLCRLNQYINDGGFHVASQNNFTPHIVANPQEELKKAYKGTHVRYVVEKALIGEKTDAVITSNPSNKWKMGTMDLKIDATTSAAYKNSRVLYYDWGSKIKDSKTVNDSVTVKIPGCVRNIEDNSLHDWYITITKAEFKWGPYDTNSNQPTEVTDDLDTRRKFAAISFHKNDIPSFTTGTEAEYNSGTIIKVDSANKFWFTMRVGDAPDGSVLLTGFSDLDQWQLYPIGQRLKDGKGNWVYNSDGSHSTISEGVNKNGPKGSSTETRPNAQNSDNSFDERVTITNTGQLASKDIWFHTDTKIAANGYPNDDSNGVNIHSSQFVNKDNITHSDSLKTCAAFFGISATGGTGLYWQGARCMTDIGIPMRNVISKSTCQTFVTYETTTENVYGNYAGDTTNPWTLLSDSVGTGYPGEAYSYTYTGAGVDTSIWNTTGTFADPNTTAPYWNPYTISYTFTGNNKDFHLYVPRIRYTYRFHDNKPTVATSTVTNMPDDITKLAGNVCGAYNRTPVLKGWNFLGFFDTPNATGGNAYNPNEVMWSDKDFYARWEPMKYYVRYNGNGATNFNENATVGMQAGEYTQNVVTGSVAYQIFEYDHVGEALRQNGFTRRGYTYVCWNFKADRTGEDRAAGYVKPATENWIKGDGTDPKANLGEGEYYVVDLYAVWRQKLGTETLTVVSEETGNPVPNVNVKLTNTSNNAERATGTTNANGQVTVNNLHWFPYKWTSTSVPAGYKDMIPVDFAINPALTADESFLTVNNTRILYMKHVKLTLNSIVDDIIDKENAPNFMYHVTGKDVAGVTHSYDVMVQTDVNSKKGKNVVPVDSGTEEPYMFAGEYTVTQYDVSRYIPRTAVNNSNTTPIGINANANLKDYDSAEVTFPYGIKQYGGFSGVHSVINKLTK